MVIYVFYEHIKSWDLVAGLIIIVILKHWWSWTIFWEICNSCSKAWKTPEIPVNNGAANISGMGNTTGICGLHSWPEELLHFNCKIMMEIKMSFFSHPSSQTPRILPRDPMDFRSRPLLLGGGANGSYNWTTITEKHNPIETTPVLGVLS